MKLLNNDECRRVIQVLNDETDPSDLSEWEYNFVTSNKDRTSFSDRQKEVITNLAEKYDCD